MTEPARRLSSEATSSGQSPAASIHKSTSPALPPAAGGAGTSHWPDRRRLSSNSTTQPQSPGAPNRSSSDRASLSSQSQRQPPQQPGESTEQPQGEEADRSSQRPTEATAASAVSTSPATRPQTQPQFAPLFALVDDGTTRTTHHPRVHYIFADDDPDILTQALTEAAAHHPPLDSPSFALPLPADPRTGRPPDRTILLDLVPNPDGGAPGYSVAAANSLSADFAVTGASLSHSPDDDGRSKLGSGGAEPGEGDAADRHLVLRIQGFSAESLPRHPAAAAAVAVRRNSPSSSGGGLAHSAASSGSGKSRGGGGPSGEEEFLALAEDFDRRMDVMRRVVEAVEAGAKARLDANDGSAVTTAVDASTVPAAAEGTEDASEQKRGS